MIYISHRLDEIRRIGDQVTVLSDGRTAATGLPGDDADERAGRADGRPQGRAALPRAADRPTGEVLLDVRDMTRLPAVRGVSLQVHAGEVSDWAASSDRGAASCSG